MSNTVVKENTMEEKILFFWKNFSVLNSAARIIPYIYSHPPSSPEKAMAPHSSTLAWRIPGTGEPVGLPSMGSHRVGHN